MDYRGAMYQPIYGNGTAAVNSQLLPFPMLSAFFPSTAQTPRYYGSGQPPPTIPINYSGGSKGTDMTMDMAANNPWSLTQSPLPITIAALLVGFLLLRFVHWR